MTGAVVPLFAATLFLASFLMFVVEPMMARQLLPVLGGTPMVWNGCVVFFQAVLLLGYGSAHILSRWFPSSTRLLVYAGLALLPLTMLHLGVDPRTVADATKAPLPWLLATLATTIGPAFLVLAVSASVVQSSLASSGHQSSRDPYFLYVASNAGSLIALVAYPTVIEPWLGLSNQGRTWAMAYRLFVVLIFACAVLAFFALPARVEAAALEAEPGSPAKRIGWSDRIRWCVLASVPSSLMLGVTTAMTTDIAPIPLLWVLPLALYLATFIIAFSAAGPRATTIANRLLPPLLLTLSVVLLAHFPLPIGPGLLLHLLTFFVAAMLCHGQLAQHRPSAQRLTEFYFWLAFGGMVGGLFNTLVAPTLFSTIVEYPIALALVAVLRPSLRSASPPVAVDVVLAVSPGLVILALAFLPWSAAQLPVVFGVLAAFAVLALSRRLRRLTFASAAGSMLLVSPWVSPPSEATLYRTRTFFGTYAIRDDRQQHHVLAHGTTVHGMESLDAARVGEPLTYYHRTGPFGLMMAGIPSLQEPGHIAAIGLGIGTLATYARPGQHWTFYEIDAAIERIARTERFFQFLPRCGSACQVVLGDARLSIVANHDARYQLIVVDAFTSDAIPLHLLTTEAVAAYLSRLAPHGVLAFHVSNRYLRLVPIVARLAAANGLVARGRGDGRKDSSWPDGKLASEWVVLARSAEDLGVLANSTAWGSPAIPANTLLWTDDFSNLFGAVHFGTR